jgi:hypothetical protein
MLIALVDNSSKLTAEHATLDAIARAVDYQLRHEFATAWSLFFRGWGCRFYEGAPPANAFVMSVFDDADAAGALGYHDVGPDGKPYAKLFLDPILENGGTLTGEGLSLSVTTSHEALELAGDPGANYWAQMPDGTLTAREMCDAVEADSYQIGSAPFVSNFLLPNWFGDESPRAGFDHLGKLAEPFTMTPGGYLILMSKGRVSQKFGAQFPEWKKAVKSFPASRTAKRSRSC